ncbi:hypothetical protein [Frankia sp. AiPs1]|uniref:hypothetical protein n=1 Tax=Frankia sp. AiPs1 TaxID=573493 RepID=UPI0020445741|nr:hypothetical protein [Frankia sp. AiPs1]
MISVNIAGSYCLPPRPDIPMALDEMIYTVTSGALRDAGLGIGDVSGSFMAASDLYDGRAIATMTLTGSTGSFHKNEMRVCNDSLAALTLAAAEVAADAAQAVIVCTWSKLSDANRDAMAALGLEPVFTRGLNAHPDAVVALRRSSDLGRPTLVERTAVESADVAVALILTAPSPERRTRGTVIGLGAANGPYLRPGEPLLGPVTAAATAACKLAGRDVTDLRRARVAGLHAVDDDELARAVGVPRDVLARQSERWADLGYAAGLLAVHESLAAGEPGPALVLSAGGIGYENAHAALVEVA